MENQLTQNSQELPQPLFVKQQTVKIWKTLAFVLFILLVGVLARDQFFSRKNNNPVADSNSSLNTNPNREEALKVNVSPTLAKTNSDEAIDNDPIGQQTYVNNSLANSMFSVTFPIGQEGWTLKHTISVDPYYIKNQNISDELILEKYTSKILVIRPEASGPSACIFNDSPNFDGPSQKFTSFVELKLGTRKARRAKVEKISPADNDKYIICQQETKSDYFVSITEFGYISYEVPIGANIDELDLIVGTLKKL